MENKLSELFHQSVEQQLCRQLLSVSPAMQPASPGRTAGEQNPQMSTHEPVEETSSRILREVAQITAQSFHSSQEAIRIALEVIGDFLDCQSLFIARFDLNEPEKASTTASNSPDQGTLKIIEARNTGAPSPMAGSEWALDQAYCATIWRTQRPLIVEDVQRHPFYRRLAITEKYNIGSYIGVPLIYSDGRVYGTLCSQDPRPRPLFAQPEKLELMQIVARFLISHIEREELTRHAQEMNDRFNEFLSIASHELKGPLTTLKDNIQFAQRTLRILVSHHAQEHETLSSIFEKLHRYLQRAAHQINIQNRLTSDLLDVSRIRAGKLELHIQPCDLGQVVRENVEDQRQMVGSRIINLELPAQKVLIRGDADRLGQVVSNYLTNACKYSSSDKPVGVAVTTDSSGVRVTVSDQGAGLTPDEQERIWERFYRAKGVQVLSGKGIGLGLGLHICKTIVEQHGGRVGLASIPGKGSRFWFTLPLNLDCSS